jgi:hypothetical protein
VEMLTLTGGLCCVGFINPIDVVPGGSCTLGNEYSNLALQVRGVLNWRQ